MRDGIVYGALVGVGFTWFEAPIYVAQGYAETGVAPWGMQLGWRYALFGFGGHALFTALFGASLGLALQTRRRWLRLARAARRAGACNARACAQQRTAALLRDRRRGRRRAAAAGGLDAPGLGFFQASLVGSAVELTVFLPFVAILAAALWRSGVWERRVIREELAPEVGRTVSAREYDEIAGDHMFRTRRIDPVATARVGGAGERAARARVPQAPRPRRGPRSGARPAGRALARADPAPDRRRLRARAAAAAPSGSACPARFRRRSRARASGPRRRRA